MSYTKKDIEKLTRAIEHINSVSYKVSLRWVFYRLFQDGFYNKKGYNSFVHLTSKARHEFFGDWTPDILADETRQAIGETRQAIGKQNVIECIEDLTANIFLNSMYDQKYYTEVWFEAKAMTGQFKKYIPNLLLRPMGGQPSIPYKWEASKALERAFSKYHHDVKILYFGDCDEAGSKIFDTIKRDITSWCNIPFKIIHCGLSLKQAKELNLPTNEKNKYQWEALTDEQARTIITKNLVKYFDSDIVQKSREQEDLNQNLIDGYIEELKEKILSEMG